MVWVRPTVQKHLSPSKAFVLRPLDGQAPVTLVQTVGAVVIGTTAEASLIPQGVKGQDVSV